MASTHAQCVFRAQALNGECPRWNVRERRLYWVDMRAPALHRLDPLTGVDESWPMPSWIGCYAFCDDGSLLVALRTGLFRFDPSDLELRFRAPPPYNPLRFCFNDGGCDRQGRFHVGPLHDPLTAEPEGAPDAAPVWRLEGSTWKAATAPVTIANGLAWSPDGRTLYHADTARKTIWAMAYDEVTGQAEAPRLFARIEEGGEIGGPDGAAVDRDGFYICAIFGEGCLLRLDPDGKVERRIAVPARYPTMPAFGGDDLATLYVTTASFPIPEQARRGHPDDGAVFALEAPVPGLPASPYRPDVEGPFP